MLPLKTSGTVAVGRVDGPYSYRSDLGDDFKHARSVEWIATDVARDAFDQDLLYSFGAFLTIGRVHRDNAEKRILASIGTPVDGAEPVDGADEAPEAETSIDPAQLAREQVRQYITQNIAGHDLAELVGAIFEASGFSVEVSPRGQMAASIC